MSEQTFRLREWEPNGMIAGELLVGATNIVVTTVDSSSAVLTFDYPRAAASIPIPLVVGVEYTIDGVKDRFFPRNDLFIVTKDGSDTSDVTETVSFTGQHYIPWLMARQPLGWTTSAKDGARLWKGPGNTSVSAGYILNGMIIEGQNLTPLAWAPSLTWDFNGATDSAGVAWTAEDKVKQEFPLNDPMSRSLQSLTDQGLCEWWTEGMMFRMFRLGTGSDKTNSVRFGGGKFTTGKVEGSFDEVITELVVVPEKYRYWLYLDNPGADERFGSLRAVMTQSGVADAATATRLAKPALDNGRSLIRELSYSWTVTDGMPRPFHDFNVGDNVKVLNRDRQWVTRRVVGMVVSQNEGIVTCTVHVGIKLLTRAAKLARRTGAATVGGIIGGSGKTMPAVDKAPSAVPMAPSGLVTTSNEGYFAADGTARSAIILEWNPVTTADDGSEIDIDAYEVLHRIHPATGVRAERTTDTEFAIDTWESGVERRVSVRARSTKGVWSEPSGELTVTPSTPTLLITAPTAPLLVSDQGNVIATWDGELVAGPVPAGFKHVVTQVGPSGTGPWTTVGGQLERAGSTMIPAQTVGDDVFVRFVPYNRLDVAGFASAAASIEVTGIDVGDIPGAITDAITDAQNDADAAQDAADAAASAAASAAGIAGGKSTVLFQSTTPAAGFQNALTLWIDTTGGNNTPKRWSAGLGAWGAVTDKAATDAAAAAAAAQSSADALRLRGNNLITNGNAELGTNHNFTPFTLELGDAPPGAAGAFYPGSAQGAYALNEYITVNPERSYLASVAVKQVNAGVASRFYFALSPYDADGLQIYPYYYMEQANTRTTLAADLVAGQTTMQLTSAANWNNAAGGNTHLRLVIFWNYVDGKGKAWPAGTYSRNVKLDAYADGGIAGNTVTLRTPHTGATIPAGTAVSNGSAGGSYMYALWSPGVTAAAVPTDQTWTPFTAYVPFAGIHTNNQVVATDKFPIATSKVRPALLANYNVSGGTSKQLFANVSLVDGAAFTAQKSADVALTTANGKNKVIFSTSPASGTSGYVEGDLWWRKSGSLIIGQWEFTSGSWAARTLDDAVIANLNAGKVTAGFISADRIDSNTISVQKLLVTSVDNLLEDQYHLNAAAAGWPISGGILSVVAGGGRASFGNALRISPNGTLRGAYRTGVDPIPLEVGQKFRVSYWVKSSVARAASMATLIVDQLNGSGTSVGTTPIHAPALSAGVWTLVSGEVTGTANAMRMRPGYYTQAGITGGTVDFTEPMIQRMSAGNLIVDGSITALKLNVSDIWADLAFINAAKVNVLTAGSVGTLHLAVGARPAVGQSANRVPSPLTDQSYWAAQIAGTNPRLFPTMTIDPAKVQAAVQGINMVSGTSDGVLPITTLTPVPESRRVHTSGAMQTLGPARLSVRWFDAAGASLGDTHAGGIVGFVHTAIAGATHYVAYISKFATAGAIVSEAYVFEVIGNAQNAARVEVTPTGFTSYDDNGDERIYLGTARSNVLNIQERNAANELVTVAYISEAGDAKFQEVTADEVVFDGVPLIGGMSEIEYNGQLLDTPFLERGPRGIVYSGGLGVDSGGRLLVDGTTTIQALGSGICKLEPGRLYEVGFDANFVANWSAAINSGALLMEVWMGNTPQSLTSPNGTVVRWTMLESSIPQGQAQVVAFTPSRPLTISGTRYVLVRIVKDIAARSYTVSNYSVEPSVVIRDIGPNIDAWDGGSIKSRVTAGSVSPINTQPTTAYYSATWSQLFDSSGSLLGAGGSVYADGRMVQGGLNDGRFGYVGFGALGLSGKTITGMWIELQNRHAGAANAQIQFGTHNHGSAPGARQARANDWTGVTARGARKRHPIPSARWGSFASGTHRGVTIGSGVGGSGGSSGNYVIFDGYDTTNATGSGRFRPRLVVTYRN